MFWERIKELRLSLGLNQAEFGKRIGVTKQCICNWENNNIQPSIDMLMKIAAAYSVSTDFLLGISSTRTLDASGLTNEQIFHIQNIINDIRDR